MGYGTHKVGTLIDSNSEEHAVDELQSVYDVIARINGVTSDDSSELTSTGTYTGQHYFYYSGKSYYCAAGITDTLTGITVNSDYNTITATSSTTSYTLLDTELFAPVPLSQSLGWIRTSQLGIVSASSSDYLDDELQAAVATYKYLIIDTEIYLSTYDSNNTMLSLDMDGQMLMGTSDGALIAGSDDLAGKYFITTTGDNIVIDHVTLKNPSRYGEGDNPVSGFRVRGQNTTVQYCTTEYCGHTYIQYWSSGDGSLVVRNTRFLFNNALNNIGNGDAGTDETSTLGESTGDAFTAWGGTCTMFGNYASAASGSDCRIAFHCEGINNSSETDNVEQGAFHIVAQNKAIGPFRRHYTFESVSYCTMTGNKSMGGMSWWNYVVVGGSSDSDASGHNILTDNIAYYDIPSDMDYGAYYSPIKAALGFNNYSTDNLVDGFHIIFADDAYCNAPIYTCENGNNYNLTLKNIDMDIGGDSVTISTGYLIDVLNGNHGKSTFENIKVSDDNDAGSYLVNIYNGTDSLTVRDVYLDSSASICRVQGVTGNLRFKNIEHLDDTGGTTVLFNFPSSANSNVVIDGYDLSGSSTARALTDTYNGLAGLVVKNITSSDAQLTMQLNGSATSGSIPAKYTLDYNSMKGVTANFYHAVSLLSDATSDFNTIGKRGGRSVIVNNSSTYEMYIAQGSSATSNWLSTDGSTTITPA